MRLGGISFVVVFALCAAASGAIAGVPPNAPQPNPNVAPQPEKHGPPPRGPSTEAFSAINVIITTGKDDLRGDSEAVADLDFGRGERATCPLKGAGADSWESNSAHAVPCPIAPHTLANLKGLRVTVTLKSHPHDLEGSDNWDIARVRLEAFNPHEPTVCFYDALGWPLVRLKGGTPELWSADVTGFPSKC